MVQASLEDSDAVFGEISLIPEVRRQQLERSDIGLLTLGDYTLWERIPGSRSTFLASHASDEQIYIVKVVDGVLDAPSLAEAKRGADSFSTASKICRVTDVLVRGDTSFAVAPYIDGLNVKQLIRRVAQQRDIVESPSWVAAATHLVATRI